VYFLVALGPNAAYSTAYANPALRSSWFGPASCLSWGWPWGRRSYNWSSFIESAIDCLENKNLPSLVYEYLISTLGREGRYKSSNRLNNPLVQKEKCEWPQQRRVNRTLPLFVCLLELLEKVYFLVLGKVIHFYFFS